MSLKKVKPSKVFALSSHEHRQLFTKEFDSVKYKLGVMAVSLTNKEITYAEEFARRVVKEKMKERVHKEDANNEHLRWVTGTLGEVALGKILEVKIHNNQVGDSSDFTVPDLEEPLGIIAGVKAFRIGNFPLTNRLSTSTGGSKNAYPQVFVCVDIDNKVAYLLGVATVDVLLENEAILENNRFVKDQTALTRKTAFTAFNQLIPFKDVKSLKRIIESQSVE